MPRSTLKLVHVVGGQFQHAHADFAFLRRSRKSRRLRQRCLPFSRFRLNFRYPFYPWRFGDTGDQFLAMLKMVDKTSEHGGASNGAAERMRCLTGAFTRALVTSRECTFNFAIELWEIVWTRTL